MPLALSEEQRDLADAVEAWSRRTPSIVTVRTQQADIAAGKPLDSWDGLLAQGLHAIHLPEALGGAGAGLPELAIVVEQLARALHPGPFLPTVITSAVLATVPTSGRVGPLLAGFADGATGALVRGGLSGRRDGDGWVVDGVSVPTLGLPGADTVLVSAEVADGGSLWFELTRAATATIHVDEPTDLTRSVGRLELSAHRVTAAEIISSPDPDRVDLIVNALLAADASGVARWCVETATDYAKTREQFGRPIGSFQAVQHKAALMLVRAETACAAAWDAARAEAADAPQQRLAAASAAVTALPAAVDNALDCVLLHGGIGFTWEHDAHLYWRRAISLASVGGPEPQWAVRLGRAAQEAHRDFAVVGDDDRPEFAAEVGAELDRIAALPETARRAALADARLVAPHYPQPWGRGVDSLGQAVIAREFARRGIAQPTTVIGEWVLPTLLAHGTAAQQDRFLTPTLRGDLVWCQLFSEPGAGSDLAGLRTRARKVDGGWLISGQKVWNSYAHQADWGVCLARSDPDAAKHSGISYFLIEMSSPGIDVRPLRQATGLCEFNEVFLDDVFVPDSCLVGGAGDGWTLAVTTLSNERLSMGTELNHGSSDLAASVIAAGRCSAAEEEMLRILGICAGRELALSALSLRNVLGRLSALDVGAEISVQKVYNAIAQRDNSRDLLTIVGPSGAVAGTPRLKSDDPVIDHLGLPAVLIGGGTIEIQLNVIARRVLGLPR